MFGSKKDKLDKLIAKKHITAIISLAKEKDEETRLAAITALGGFGQNDDAFNALIPMLSDHDGKTRAAASESLGAMHNDHAKAFIAHALSIESDPSVKQRMADAMAMLKTE
ncbi:MAG: HEAT repeat domain-containing protein [Eubacteriales bacterium]|nr:HEAT repeat domain-containing protein [Eubacteriales bacterium]MDD3883048.1 HEAT repeat domain-containing protein [Eubacteriales bacterium]MDD4513599.1 HEAT repeat domain-containing protein [Eubacteriales bacterium]